MESSSIITWLLSLVGGAATGFVAAWAKLSRYQQKVDDLVEKGKEHANDIKVINNDLSAFKEFKLQAQKFMDDKFYKSNSPVSLTPLGEQLIKNSGFEDVFLNEKDKLSELLSSQHPKTKYDVQEKARALLDSMQSYEAFMPVKTYAFNKGADLGQILRAGSILLRDYYLETHPEINK